MERAGAEAHVPGPVGVRQRRGVSTHAGSRRRLPVSAHDHHVALGLGEILLGRAVDVAPAQSAADAELRATAADQVGQPAFAQVARRT
ncbi:MAG: hypothetical protein DLM58_18665 [Pseudonocardiales bacterium]|nr:MAG: hypothetical protein DLM58_18665 [Pseudonocardiales bacterium]